MKTCNKCKLKKDINLFCKNKNFKDGINSICRDCVSSFNKEYYIKNKEKEKQRAKEYRELNKDSILKKDRDYKKKNKEKLNSYKQKKDYKEKQKLYKKENANKIAKNNKIWREDNKERLKKCRIKYVKENRHNYNFYAANRRASLKNATPSWAELSKIKLLYKKSKWLTKITGIVYHVDHVVPLQNEKVCGLHVWANLQILEASENIKKKNKLEF